MCQPLPVCPPIRRARALQDLCPSATIPRPASLVAPPWPQVWREGRWELGASPAARWALADPLACGCSHAHAHSGQCGRDERQGQKTGSPTCPWAMPISLWPAAGPETRALAVLALGPVLHRPSSLGSRGRPSSPRQVTSWPTSTTWAVDLSQPHAGMGHWDQARRLGLWGHIRACPGRPADITVLYRWHPSWAPLVTEQSSSVCLTHSKDSEYLLVPAVSPGLCWGSEHAAVGRHDPGDPFLQGHRLQ